MAGEAFERERAALAVLQLDRHRLEVDGGEGERSSEHGLVHLGRYYHRHEPILRGIGAKDVGERRADDRPEACIEEGPGSVLTRGAAAEVRAGDKDPGAGGSRIVERESRTRAAVRLPPPVGEESLAEPFAPRRLEIPGGGDLVGIDVALREHDGAR